MSIPANAVLVEIRAPGPVDDFGDQADDGPVLWSGRAPAYLKRRRTSKVSRGQAATSEPSGNQRESVDELWVLDSVSPAAYLAAAGADWEACTVLIDDQRAPAPARRRFTVTAAEHRAGGTIADNVKLTIDADRAGG